MTWKGTPYFIHISGERTTARTIEWVKVSLLLLHQFISSQIFDKSNRQIIIPSTIIRRDNSFPDEIFLSDHTGFGPIRSVFVRPFVSFMDARPLTNGTYEKSWKEKSCSLPIIYLLLLFLSSICIKYLNWEIPNVHNLQQASNPGKNFKISYGSLKTCHSRVEHNTWICYGKYNHIKERQHQRRSKASCRSTRIGNVIKNLVPMAWAI